MTSLKQGQLIAESMESVLRFLELMLELLISQKKNTREKPTLSSRSVLLLRDAMAAFSLDENVASEQAIRMKMR